MESIRQRYIEKLQDRTYDDAPPDAQHDLTEVHNAPESSSMPPKGSPESSGDGAPPSENAISDVAARSTENVVSDVVAHSTENVVSDVVAHSTANTVDIFMLAAIDAANRKARGEPPIFSRSTSPVSVNCVGCGEEDACSTELTVIQCAKCKLRSHLDCLRTQFDRIATHDSTTWTCQRCEGEPVWDASL